MYSICMHVFINTFALQCLEGGMFSQKLLQLFFSYRLCDERAAEGCQGPHNQTRNHDILPVVAVAKVTKDRSQE